MRKNIKIGGFAIGIILLFLIFQYQFSENDSWKAWNLPLSGKIIIIDPGHGGPDGGAVGGEVLEKDIALKIALKVRDYLQQQGALVQLTREDDRDLASDGTTGYSRRKVEDLRNRVEYINDSNSDFFISIHLNAIPSPRWSGAQTFYFPSYMENERAAKFIQDELRRNLENTSRKAKPINTVYLLKHAKKPGVLVEVGFLSNQQERELLSNEKYQEKVAISVYKGVLRYFTNETNPPE